MKVNQIRAGAILSYLSMGLGVVISLVYTPVMVDCLGSSEYAVYNLVLPIISYLSLMSLGLGSAYVRYYSRYKVAGDKKNMAKLNGMFLVTYSVLGTALLALGFPLSLKGEWLFGSKLTAEEIQLGCRLLRIMSVNAALCLPISVFESHVAIQERYLFQKILAMGKQVLNPLLMIPLLLLGYRSVTLTVVALGFTVVSGLVNVYYCLVKLEMPFRFGRYDFRLMREMMGFTVYVFIGIVVNNFNWAIDRLLLGWIHGTDAVTIYVPAAQLNTYFLSIATIISGVLIPRVNRIVAEKRPMRELDALFTKTGRLQFIILSCVLWGFVAVGRPFVVLWMGAPEFSADYTITLILMFACVWSNCQTLGGHEYAPLPLPCVCGGGCGQHPHQHPPVYAVGGGRLRHRHHDRHHRGRGVFDELVLLQEDRPEHPGFLEAPLSPAAGHAPAGGGGAAHRRVRKDRQLFGLPAVGAGVRGGVRREYVALRPKPL